MPIQLLDVCGDVLVLVGQCVVETLILLFRDVLRVAGPQRPISVHKLPLQLRLFHFLCLLLRLLRLLLLFLHRCLWNLFFSCLLFLLLLIDLHLRHFLHDFHLLLRLLCHLEVDGEVDELRIVANQIFQTFVFEKLDSIVFQVQTNLSATAQHVAARVLRDCERVLRRRRPHQWLVIHMFRVERHAVGHKIDGIESNAELANQIEISALLGLLQELARPRAGNRAERLHQIDPRHPHTGVADTEHVLVLHGVNADFHGSGVLHDSRIRQRNVPDLVQSVRPVRNQLNETGR